MAIIGVTRVREFEIDAVTNRGSEQYYIYFDVWTSHQQMASECLGAVDPVTSMTTPSEKGQSLDSIYFPDAIVSGLSPFPRDGQNLAWQLNVSYGEIQKSNEVTDSSSQVFGDFPWKLPNQYNWSHYFDQAIMTLDKDGKPLLNSAGDAFESDVVVDRTIRTCNVSFNTPLGQFNPKVTGDFINTVNSSDLTVAGSVFPKKTIKCLSYDSSVEAAQVVRPSGTVDILYNVNTVSIAYDPFKWDGFILYIGNNEGEGRGRITDNDLIPFSTPQRLNGAGIRLIQITGDIPNDLQTNPEPALQLDVDRSVAGVMAMLNYKRYNEKDLNIIGL